jgi:uncharacterized protein
MFKTHPISISCETHGLAGNLVLPEGASPEQPVLGALIIGGPGPLPMDRYSPEGMKQWPVQWTEALGEAGLAGLCYDQRGSGLSSGLYHEADWDALYEDNKAALDLLRVQPEVSQTAVIAWGEGCSFALQLAAEGLVDAVVLMAPAYFTAEERYMRWIRSLAATKNLSERVIQLRLNQWKGEVMATVDRVQQGERTATTALSENITVMTNLVRFLQLTLFDPAPLIERLKVPVLLLHGEQDNAIPASESEAIAHAMSGKTDRILYPGVAHFLFKHTRATTDAVGWLKQI